MTQAPEEEKHNPRRFILIWLPLLLIIATCIRVHNADTFYLSPDEAMHVKMAEGNTLAEVWHFSQYETHPPLGNILRHYWMQMGNDVWFVRAQSLIFGIALILLYYRIGFMLGGEWVGMACAGLIAFSHGCIIQSFVVRNYIFFVFFLSLSFYYYLRWRDLHKHSTLIGYIFWGWLAALTHFTAIFCILSINIFEAIHLLWHKASLKQQLIWAATNLAIALVAMIVYHAWQPLLAPLQGYFALLKLHIQALWAAAPLYPLVAAEYILPGPNLAFSMLVFLGIAASALPKHIISSRIISQRGLVSLIGIAFALCIVLMLTNIFTPLGSRRNMWLLPLLIPPAGCMLAALIQRSLMIALPSLKHIHLQIGAIIILVSGCLLYNQQERFDDGSEYVWQQYVWNDFTHYMQKLGPTDLVVTEKDDGIMLANLYPVMADDAFTGAHMAALAPYGNTHILFNPYYPRNYSTDVMLVTLQEAQKRHMFDTVDTLVFLHMAWSKSPIADLMLCPALSKQLLTFPTFTTPDKITRNDIERARAAIMLVPKETFVKDVLSPSGKARSCLSRQKEMLPGFTPITP
jgi:hypothetical protein